jgi:hypothetical protein
VRAIAGYAAADAADPDDRGFLLDPTFANSHGPAFGISGPDGANPAQECRIRVMRDRIEPTAQLFPEIADAGLVTLVTPAAGSALNPAGAQPDTIVVRAASAPAADTSTLLKLHYGSAAGPVIAECVIRVHSIHEIPVKGHIVSINGSKPACDADKVNTFTTLVTNANKILMPAGIKLVLDANILDTPVMGLTTNNTLTLSPPGFAHWDHEIAVIMRANPQPAFLNAYIVGQIQSGTSINGTRGVGLGRDFVATNAADGVYPGAQTGFVMYSPDDLEAFGATFAHELGHVLGLEHYGNHNDIPGDATIADNWSMRNLMYNYSNLSTGAPQDQVGYGPHLISPDIRRGMFIGIKRLAGIVQSNQADTMRTGFNNDAYLPV